MPILPSISERNNADIISGTVATRLLIREENYNTNESDEPALPLELRYGRASVVR